MTMMYHTFRLGVAILFYAILCRKLTIAAKQQTNHSPDVDEYVYYQGVQGKPGVDFPIYSRIPRTSFSCKKVPSGYYADLETDCQVFHICNDGTKISFLCPNGTIFQQSDLICEWWFKVNCTNSPNLYEESAEQLLEDTWRRKANRKPGYQNRFVGAGQRKKSHSGRKENKVEGQDDGSRDSNANEREQYENVKGASNLNENGKHYSNLNRDIQYDTEREQHTNIKETYNSNNGVNHNNHNYEENASGDSYIDGNSNIKHNFNNNKNANYAGGRGQHLNNLKNNNHNYDQTLSSDSTLNDNFNVNQNVNYENPSQEAVNYNANTGRQSLNIDTNEKQIIGNQQLQTRIQNQNYDANYNAEEYSKISQPQINSNSNQKIASNNQRKHNLSRAPNGSTRRKETARRISANKDVVNQQVFAETRNKQVNGNRGNHKYRNQVTLDKERNELNYDDSSEETQVPQETASFYKNNQNVIQNTNKVTTGRYPNHKETYTEVHEPKFYSTKAYTTGTQTISPQTHSTNRVPLNDGKPFVITTPKSSYNIKEFSQSGAGTITTEGFKYSPTVPPFMTPKKGSITTMTPQIIVDTESVTNTDKYEEVTFSSPYSNVVTEQQGKKEFNDDKASFNDQPSTTPGYQQDQNVESETTYVTPQINSFSEIDDIVHFTPTFETAIEKEDNENLNGFVRIRVQGTQNVNGQIPEKIKLTVSSAQPTKVSPPTKSEESTIKSPTTVHRRYSAALSQANPNNACIDEVTTTTTTRKPDFQVVIGRQRSEDQKPPTTESQLIKITQNSENSIVPKINRPRTFEKVTESPIYRLDLQNKVVEKVTEDFTLKPTGFYVTKTFDQGTEILETHTTKFGSANTYLPKITTGQPFSPSNSLNIGTPDTNSGHGNENHVRGIENSAANTLGVDHGPKGDLKTDIVLHPKPFELPPKQTTQDFVTSTQEATDSPAPNYQVSSARPFSLDVTVPPTLPTPSFRNPKVFEHVSSMLNTIRDIIKERNESETRPGLVVPPSAGPQTLHSLAVYFANALDGVNEDENSEKKDDNKGVELLSIPTLNRYKDLFKDEAEEKHEVTTVPSENDETNDLEGQHTKNGVVTPRVRQLAQVFTKALSSYLDDPDMFRKYLKEVRPTEPTNVATTSTVTDTNTEEDELLNYSDTDIKPDLPKLSTTPSVSPTWGYIFAPNNSNNFEYNSISTDAENLQSADSQSFVSQFNNYIKEKHYGSGTTPISTSTGLPNDHWTVSQNATKLWKDKLYTNPQAINEDLNTKNVNAESTTETTESTEITYELRSLPKLELNSTQVHGILIDFMNTTKNENNRLKRILLKLNTTQDEFLDKMREIEQNPLTRRLILLLISECANNITHHEQHSEGETLSASSYSQVARLPSLFESSRIAEGDKHIKINSPIPKFVDHTLTDEDEDTRALQLLNSLYTIASKYGK